MSVRLAESHYGKAAVRLVVVQREGGQHKICDWTVDVRFGGDYAAAHESGDNSHVYPTDSMKNSVYALARDQAGDGAEEFARRLARHFLARPTPPASVEVTVVAHSWKRIEVAGEEHSHAFVAGSSEQRLAKVSATPGDEAISAGVRELVVLKSAGSGFSGFPRDRFTTLAETPDRIFATAIDAGWDYERRPADFEHAFVTARRHLLESFATHDSLSVQHTLYAMGRAVLEGVSEIEEIRLTLPNRHHLRVDLEPFGHDNPNVVFVATSEPYGKIEGILRRG